MVLIPVRKSDRLFLGEKMLLRMSWPYSSSAMFHSYPRGLNSVEGHHYRHLYLQSRPISTSKRQEIYIEKQKPETHFIHLSRAGQLYWFVFVTVTGRKIKSKVTSVPVLVDIASYIFCRLGSNNRPLRIWKQNVCKILFGRQIASRRTWKSQITIPLTVE